MTPIERFDLAARLNCDGEDAMAAQSYERAERLFTRASWLALTEDGRRVLMAKASQAWSALQEQERQVS